MSGDPTRLARRACTRCGVDVLISGQYGRTVVLEAQAFRSHAVPEHLAYAWSRTDGLVHLLTAPGRWPAECLMTHLCQGDPVPDPDDHSPRLHGSDPPF